MLRNISQISLIYLSKTENGSNPTEIRPNNSFKNMGPGMRSMDIIS